MSFSRRQFLSLATLTLASAASPMTQAFAKPLENEKNLKLLNLHTGERINATYWSQGNYHIDALQEINHFFRDHRNGAVTQIDPTLLNSIHNLTNQLEHQDEIHIISGYRSAETNEKLRQQGRKVAKKSLHMQGRAIDLRLPKRDLKHIHKAALHNHKGGVGFYPKSNFIHLDTGRIRQWG